MVLNLALAGTDGPAGVLDKGIQTRPCCMKLAGLRRDFPWHGHRHNDLPVGE